MSTGTRWREEGACLQMDPELFFPIGVTGPAAQQTEQAKQVCAGCPVRDPCLTFAVKAGIDHGVWGGYSEEERRFLKRRAAQTRARL